MFYWLNNLIYKLALKTKKKAGTHTKAKCSKERKRQAFSGNMKILIQPKSILFSSLQSCLIYIKMYQFGFSNHISF